MVVPLRHMIRSHLRPSLIIALGAAVVTFGGVMIWRVNVDVRQDRDRLVAEQELRDRQEVLEERLSRVETLSAADRDRLATVVESVGGENGDMVGAGTPERLRDVVGSITELVCIDNNDKEVYYTASGMVVDRSGLILTNRHILLSDDGSLIEFCGVGFTEELQDSPMIEYVATARAEHVEADLALLEIIERLDGGAVPESFDTVILKDNAVPAHELGLGDSIFIGGYPGIGADTFTFTQGVVSGRVGTNLIKTSALIDSGTSGGAAFDMHGRFVGVPTAAVRGEIGGSLGYLISSDAVDEFLNGYYGGEFRIVAGE